MSVTRRIFTAATLTASLALAACGGGSNGSIDGPGADDRSLGSVDAPVTMIAEKAADMILARTGH